jgi:hypothetical protein
MRINFSEHHDIPKTLLRAFLTVCCVFILNTLMTFHDWIPEFDFSHLLKIAPETLGVLTLLLAASFVRKRREKLFFFSLSFILTLYFVFTLGETVTRHMYRRGFYPLIDLLFFREVLRLVSDSGSAVARAGYFFLLCMIVAVFFTAFFFLLSALSKNVTHTKHRFILLLMVAGFLIVFSATFGLKDPYVDNIIKQFGVPTPPDGEKNGEKTHILRQTSHVEHGTHIDALEGDVFPGLKDNNIFLFIVESYGYTAFAKKEHFNILEPLYLSLQKKFQDNGYGIVSKFLGSPVIGGYSWIADSTLLTGVKIGSQVEYDHLLESDTQTLVSVFNDAGYFTVLSAPGTLREWPEGERFYGFDRYIYAKDFHYQGPEFSFVPVPDQFCIHSIHTHIVQRCEKPFFIQYLLVSSHAPFNRIPIYIDDWAEIGDGSIYYETENLFFENTWFSGKQYTEGYTAAISYVLTVIAEYLTRFIHDDALAIIVGDHQPKYPVTERGQPLSVPIHLISRNAHILRRFEGMGYTQGFIPFQEPPHPGLETFHHDFLTAISHDGNRLK